jgi:DNA-binding LacI/PurR family transcriptional regulator/DNA-binding transcriptional regulator YhcF (GntR family)
MSPETLEFSAVHRLATKLERDIRLKSLSPGDRYLTAAEVAETLGVSRTVANRAMLLLAQRALLVRRRGQGTLIGPAMRVDSALNKPARTKSLQSVLLLEPAELLEIGMMGPEAMLPLVRRRFDQAAIHMLCLPPQEPLDYVKQIIERARQVGGGTGAIAISCPRSVYQYLAESGVPTVVFGSLYPDLRQVLPSVDFDYYEAGQLLVQCLAGRGHRRIGLLLGEAGRAGTEHLLNGVLAGIHAAGLSAADLVARFYPGSKEGFMAQVRDLLSMPDRPSGVITDGACVDWVNAAATELGLSIPEQLDICYLSYMRGVAGPLACPHLEPQESPDQVFTRVVEMLWRRSQGMPMEENNVVIPVSVQGT